MRVRRVFAMAPKQAKYSIKQRAYENDIVVRDTLLGDNLIVKPNNINQDKRLSIETEVENVTPSTAIQSFIR